MRTFQIVAAAVSLLVHAPCLLQAQEGWIRPFIGVAGTEGPRGNWSGTAGLSLLTTSGLKLSLDVTTYFDGIATGRHWTTFGLEARTRPLLNDRVYFLGGPRASWIGPVFSASGGAGYLASDRVTIEAAIHQERYKRQISVGLRLEF